MIRKPLDESEVLALGFKPVPHFTVAGNLNFDLGRKRILSLGSIGTPNEMLWICQIDSKDNTEITDLVCLHNYDYDGYLTIGKLEDLIKRIK